MMSDDIREYLHNYKNIAFSKYVLVLFASIVCAAHRSSSPKVVRFSLFKILFKSYLCKLYQSI